MQQSADRLLMVQTFIYSAVMYGAEVWNDEGGQRQDVSGRKALPILAHPRDCSSDVLYGTLGYFHPVYSLMLPNCVSADAQNMEAGRW
jgi:hypothetical protein